MRACECTLKLTAALCFVAAVSVPGTVRAGTDANGFVDEWLTAIGYTAPGCDGGGAAGRAEDYLCDGVVSESTIIPEIGLELGPPVLDPEDCAGDDVPALENFDDGARLDPTLTLLPISADLVSGDTLDFIALTIPQDQNPGSEMAYAWVWVENTSGAPVNVTAGIGSDDAINVEVNRTPVFDFGGCRGSGGAGAIQNRFPVTFQPGGNLVQVKVFQGGGGWNFRMRFEDEKCNPLLSGEGPLTIGVEPIELFEPAAERTIEATGSSPDPVNATITITVDNDDAAYSLMEAFDSGWTASNMTPGAADSGPGFVQWDNITAETVSYELSRSDLWTPDQGEVSGSLTLAGVNQAVVGETQILGGVQPFADEVLVTASMIIPDDPVTGDPIQGCNVSEASIAGDWISDGAGLTDENIVPEEGLEILPDFLGESQAGGYSLDVAGLPPGLAPPDDATPMALERVSSDDTGLFNWQRGDIYGADINDTMNVAFFYVVNTQATPRRVVLAFGTDDSGGIRVNGKPVWQKTVCRGNPGFGDLVEVTLRPGKNLISAYTFENGGGYNMRIRFEDLDFNPLSLPTTVDPEGYSPDPAFDPEPNPVALAVTDFLVSPSYGIGDNDGAGNDALDGCNVNADQIAGDWITGVDGDGNEITDATIIPSDGMIILPDFGGAAPNNGGHVITTSAAGQNRFWTVPGDAEFTEGIIRTATRENSRGGLIDWQGNEVYSGGIDDTMNVAWFYVVNDEDEARCVQVGFGSDDAGGVRVNGRPVHAMPACRGHPGFADKFRVQLDPGKNLVAAYTFENGGGYNMCIRFEDELGAPLVIGRDLTTTLDPTGYDPAAHPEPDCPPVEPEAPAYVREGGATGLVSEYLVNAVPFSQGGGSGLPGSHFPEDFVVDADGNPPGLGSIQEGAIVQPGTAGTSVAPVTTGFLPGRGADVCGFTTLVRFNGFTDGDGAGDPSDFNGEAFYGNPDNYSASLFFYINNLTDDDLEAWVGVARDDAASLFVNGELIAEHTSGRGRGGNNVLQTFADMPALIEPGPNLVQLSYVEGGGGSGARVGFFPSTCFDEAFSEDQVEVSANPPGFVPTEDTISVTRTITPFPCDGETTVTLTVSVAGGGSADLDLVEELPDGVTGSNPSAGSFDAGGTTLTFNGQASDGMEITYEVSEAVPGLPFCTSTANGSFVGGDTVLQPNTDVCADLDVLEEIGYFVNCGAAEFVDILGRTWREDSSANPSKHLVSPNANTANFGACVADTSFDDLAFDREYPPEVFPTERWDDGDIIYEFTELPAGSYEVVLLFMEGCCSDGCEDIADPAQSAGGCRVFDILVNGEIVADQFSQKVQAALQAGLLPDGTAANCIGITQQFTANVGNDGVLNITIDDLGGGNPPENASIKGIAIRKVDGVEPPDQFIRGDIDGDGLLNITDAIVFLGWRFLGDPPPPCLDAADVDDRGDHNITDAIFLLQFQFLGTAPPPDPGPTPGQPLSAGNCGTDPTADDFDCAEPPALCGG